MDYEERYNEALNRAREIHRNEEEKRRDMEWLFPELEESEDERIRKAIHIYLDWLDGRKDYQPKGEYTIRDMIAWLEKQSQTFTKKDVDDAWLKGMCDAKHELEKQGEQKSADKVEPKFHEGEWLCGNEPNNYAHFIQILEIVNVRGKDMYSISRDIHEDEDVVEFGFVEKYYHKFDIQDAKDGDVLACGDKVTDCPFIFHNLNKDLNPRYYCGVNTLQNFQENDENGGCWCHAYEVRSATEEQRNLLFAKMKEAGYEWDSEKKELKKQGEMSKMCPTSVQDKL